MGADGLVESEGQVQMSWHSSTEHAHLRKSSPNPLPVPALHPCPSRTTLSRSIPRPANEQNDFMNESTSIVILTHARTHALALHPPLDGYNG